MRLRVLLAGLLALLAVLIQACGGGGGGPKDRLILVRNEGIVELSLASGEETLLVPSPPESFLIEPAVSPDGTRFAYARQLTPIALPGQPPELGTDLYLAAPDGSDARLLQEHTEPNEQFRTPSWLPDGKQLLVSVQRLSGSTLSFALEQLNIDTGERKVVVENAFRPAVADDGFRIAYVRQDAQLLQTLWVASLDGSGERQVAGPEEGIGSINTPRFSPDGTRLAFGASELPQQGRGRDETRYASLASASGGGVEPARSLNGLPMDIWVVNVDGTGLRKLAELQQDLPSVAWSADGKRLFVLGGTGLYDIDPESGEATQVGEGTFHGQVDWLAAK